MGHRVEIVIAIDRLTGIVGPQTLYFSNLKKEIRGLALSDAIILETLDHLSHNPKIVNKDYQFPTDYEKLDFGFKPLTKLSGTKFLLPDKAWCAIGFYEVLATLCRHLDTKKIKSNDQIGYALENYVYHKLSQKNIKFAQGKYADESGVEGELDCLIESTDNIVLIEIKKKVLTRVAKTGSDVKLIVDLSATLLDAQVQNGRSELVVFVVFIRF